MKKNLSFGARMAAAVVSLLALAAAPAVAAPKGDVAAIVGTWKAAVGYYEDGTTEKDLGMSLVFTAVTMSDPKSKTGETHPYKIDPASRSISIRDKDLEMRLAYRLDGPDKLSLDELVVVKAGKTTVIIGKGDLAMFASLEFRRQ
jgi:hypothetical protein